MDTNNDDTWEKVDKEFTARNTLQEQQLKSGQYALIKYSHSVTCPSINMTPECKEAYLKHIENGDSEDLAFWRVVRTFGIVGFGRMPGMAVIKKGYEGWVTIRERAGREFNDMAELVFQREKCIVDRTAECFQQKGSMSQESFEWLKQDAEEVELIHW
jgi:hypothetical protein